MCLFKAPEHFLYTHKNIYTNNADGAFIVTGDALAPRYKDGDILLIKSQINVEDYDPAIWLVNGELQIRRKISNRLISLNPRTAPIIIGSGCQLVGPVIGILDPDWVVDEQL